MKSVLSSRTIRALAPLALAGVAACGSDNATSPGTNGNVTAAQKAALLQLFANEAFTSTILSGGSSAGAAFFPLIASNIQNIGSVTLGASASASRMSPLSAALAVPNVSATAISPASSYQAFGGQYVITVTGLGAGSDGSVVWTGLVGVNDLNTPTDVFTAGVVNELTTTAPSSIASTNFVNSESAPEGSTFATASYIKLNGQQGTVYNATSGQITVTSVTFSGSTACPGITGVAAQYIKSCSFSNGTLKGNFNFNATQVTGGTNTVAIPATTVSIPATRLTMTIDLSSAQ